MVGCKPHECINEGFKQHLVTGNMTGQQRLNLLHALHHLIDRCAAQLVIEQITAGFDILNAHGRIEVKCLIFRMPVIGDEDCNRTGVTEWKQLYVLQCLVAAFRPQHHGSQRGHLR